MPSARAPSYRPEELTRLCVRISEDMRRRIHVRCALEGTTIQAAVIELLEQAFPPDLSDGLDELPRD